MIRRLRRRHRLLITLLAAVAPVVFALALAARQPVPVVTELPGVVAESWRAIARGVGQVGELHFSGLSDDGGGVSSRLDVRGRLLENEAEGRRWVALYRAGEPGAADLLLYWSAQTAEVGAPLPGDVNLLGRLSATADYDDPALLPLPAGDGSLLLYSLVHHRVMAVAALPAVPAEGG